MPREYKIMDRGDSWRISNRTETEVIVIPVVDVPPLIRDIFSDRNWSPCGKVVYARLSISTGKFSKTKKFIDGFQYMEPQGW